MGFVDDHQKVFGEIVDQRGRGLARRPPAQMAGIVFDAVAVPHGTDHFEIELRPLLDPLRFDQLIVLSEIQHALLEFLLNPRDRPLVPVRRYQVVRIGIDRHLGQLAQRFSRQRIDLMDCIDDIAE